MNNRKLFVGNLTYSVRAGQLRDLFSKYGTVIDVTVLEQKGYGFVEMKSPEEAAAAKAALSEKEFEGRNLLIDGLRPPLNQKKKGKSQGARSFGRDHSKRSKPGSKSGSKPANRSHGASSGKKRTNAPPGRMGSSPKGKASSGDKKPRSSSSTSTGSNRRYWGGMK